ncbi:MAG: HNH endonuclease [Vulcanimicrobiota bacterium]
MAFPGAGSEAGTGLEGSGSAADITHCEPDIPSEESDEERKSVMMHFNVSHKLALIWDFAVEHFRNKEHYSGSLAGFVEAILADDSGSLKGAGMSIRFFLPEDLYELWNMMAMNWLIQATAEEAPMRYVGYAEGFLAALLQDYLLTERIHLKAAHNYAILKRDHFQCQVPGCKCRRNLEVHHIIWRSKGGGDEHWNLLTVCQAPQTHSSRSDGSEDRRHRSLQPDIHLRAHFRLQ